MENKFDILYYPEGGKANYEIKKEGYPSLIIEEQVLAEMTYLLFSEGVESMIQFLKREGVYED